MAELSSPIAGGIRAVRRNVSSSAFTGRAVAPPNDSISDNIIAQNSLSLNNVSQSLQNISGQVNQLTFSLSLIRSNLAVQSQLDRQREEAEAQRERQAAQQGLRKGKEGIIEQGIQNALFSPLRSLGKKTQFGLGKLANFFTILLTGWLGDKLIKAYGFLADGNKVALNKLARNVIGTLGTIAAVLLSFKLAFKGVLLTLGVIGLRIGRFGRNKIFITPIRMLGNMITRASIAFLRGLKNPFRSLGRGGIPKPGSVNPKSGLLQNTLGVGSAGLISFGLDTYAGKPAGESLAAATGGMTTLTLTQLLTRSLTTAPGFWPKFTAFILNTVGFNIGYQQVDNAIQKNKQGVTPSDDGNIMPSMMSPISDQDLLNEIKLQKPERDDFGTGRSGAKSFEKALDGYNDQYGERIKTLESKITPKNEIKDIKNLRSKRDMDMSSIGQEPELPPVVVPMPSSDGGGDQQQGGVKGGSATGYPMIAAVDPTNLHVYISYKMFNISPALA
tara:strand:- start:16740 stop:18242 length:1503 start_codon:yes stop_codon:yes gene_type:complete